MFLTGTVQTRFKQIYENEETTKEPTKDTFDRLLHLWGR
jgi:hypothetical protein